MSPAERDAEAKKWERGISFEETRPLTKRSKAMWETAKRGRGRPRKATGDRAKRVLISLDPKLFALVETFASSKGLDRSKLFSLSVRAFIAADHAVHDALTGNGRKGRRKRDAAAPPKR
jgi:hypothetical protein